MGGERLPDDTVASHLIAPRSCQLHFYISDVSALSAALPLRVWLLAFVVDVVVKRQRGRFDARSMPLDPACADVSFFK